MNAAQLTTEVNVLTERAANFRHELDETKATLQRLEVELREARQERPPSASGWTSRRNGWTPGTAAGGCCSWPPSGW
jgi:hypothetical protein